MFKKEGLPYLPAKYKRGGKLWAKALEDLEDKMFTFLIHEEDVKFFGVLCWILRWQAKKKEEKCHKMNL
ncbi:hypothetical protein LCGC14_2667610 [marine sediment metagenome]|uniref:Uncharacterized protein n=1 Tax=marine sediment metagenome TaxID=412755 RepID=A0A0F9CGZ0_9ZZZZ